MGLLSMAARLSAFLFFEGEREYSRDEITVISGAGVLAPGSVLGKITASGKYTLYDNGAADGSEVAACVLLSDADAASADVDGAVVLTRFGIVKTDGLIWEGTQDAADKLAGLADLLALNPPIISRDAI